MKARLVQTTGLSSNADINISYAVEYKKRFFSKWETLYQTDYVDSIDKARINDRRTKCEKLLKALKARGAHKIKTVIGE
ncbi:hypothetical protein ACQ46_gp222 [Citrobacter phage Moon]|uniref:Uncharacterized protein n=1 Tax=Citrobacter phage Moon TaxID=1540095 RepID=A0A0A0YR28_9CAUD|nr:hypothetical protein ACQ46_gp222 [Citrobacter phage Moon]AIX12202.1 hypothetical protein CPT_Moon231 [Citrobacter phage Moon]